MKNYELVSYLENSYFQFTKDNCFPIFKLDNGEHIVFFKDKKNLKTFMKYTKCKEEIHQIENVKEFIPFIMEFLKQMPHITLSIVTFCDNKGMNKTIIGNYNEINE